MGTIKVNSRSPYYLVSSGAEGSAVENALLTIDGPVKGTVDSNITLTAQPINFTPVSYAWTGGAIAGSSSAELTFTETSGGEVTYGVTATDSAGNTYTASQTVSWSANPQFEATLTVTNNISGPSQGYTIGGDLNGTKKTGETGDGYSFTTVSYTHLRAHET